MIYIRRAGQKLLTGETHLPSTIRETGVWCAGHVPGNSIDQRPLDYHAVSFKRTATFIKVHFLSAGEPNEGAVRFVWSSCSCIIHCILLRAGGVVFSLPQLQMHIYEHLLGSHLSAGMSCAPLMTADASLAHTLFPSQCPAPWRTWCLWFWHFRKPASVGVLPVGWSFILILTLPENLIWLAWLSDCKDVAML